MVESVGHLGKWVQQRRRAQHTWQTHVPRDEKECKTETSNPFKNATSRSRSVLESGARFDLGAAFDIVLLDQLVRITPKLQRCHGGTRRLKCRDT